MTAPHRRFLPLLALASVAPWVAVGLGVARGKAPPGWLGWDLASFRVASQLWLHHQPLYDFAAQAQAHERAFGPAFDVPYPFSYPPIFAIELAPLAELPQSPAFAVVWFASLVVLAIAARRVTGRLSDALWVTASFPGLLALLAGQFVFFALGILVATHALLRRERPVTAGLVASLLAFKPQLLLFLPLVFAMQRRARRGLFGLAAGVAAQLAICLVAAPSDTRAFPAALGRFNSYVATHFKDTLSFTWRAFFALALPGHGTLAAGCAAVAMVACAAVGVVAMWRARADTDACLAIAVLATLASTWHCAPYDWVLLALPAWLLLPRTSPSRGALRAIGLLYIGVWGFVALADVQRSAFGVALHPAMPALCGLSFWLVRSSRIAV